MQKGLRILKIKLICFQDQTQQQIHYKLGKWELKIGLIVSKY